MKTEVDFISLGFLALSDVTRRSMLLRLLKDDLTIGALAENYQISLPAISKHINVLERAGLVSVEKFGRQKRVKLVFESLNALQIWIESLGGSESFLDQLEDRISEFLDPPES